MPETNSPSSSVSWRLPRWLLVCQWLLGISAFHILLPWGITRSGIRYGWHHGYPSMLNTAALLPVALGLAVIGWALGGHFIHGREGYEFSATAPYLLRRGPYRYTRNPMYIAALLIWVGWSVFFGSILLLFGSTVIWVALEFIIIPFEERRLEARFGDSYLAYKNRVGRWIL